MVSEVSGPRRIINDDYDAIVVGSGATGGVAALALTRKGLKTLVLEAGPHLKGPRSYGSPLTNLGRQLKSHWLTGNQRVQEWHGGYWETNPNLFIDDRENPYSTPEDKPYLWIRGRQVGGRSHTWGGVCLRFSDFEFKAPERDGKGSLWPIAYRDLDPFYGCIERILKVHGARDGLAQLPDGEFLEPGRLSPGEVHIEKALQGHFGPGRRLVISRGIRAGRRAEGGDRYSRLSSNQTTLREAEATALLSVYSNAVVHKILFDPVTSRATGVEFIDAATGAMHRKHAKLIVLCASSLETVRILLNSKSPTFPEGLGTTSGLLGQGIMDHIASTVYFYLPDLPEESGFELLGSEGAIIPRYAHGVTRGYGYWGGVSRLRFPGPLRRDPKVALGFFCGMGEALQSEANRVTLHPSLKDKWGVPAVHIDYSWLGEDLKLAEVMKSDIIEMVVHGAGGKLVTLMDILKAPFMEDFVAELHRKWELSIPGAFVHEVGGARMGDHPSRSVTNPFGRVWDCPNIVIGDGAVFPSSAWQNPTLTEMALCERACENAVERLKRGEL